MSDADSRQPTVEVDARGLYCPLPVLRLARGLLKSPAGTVARLLATDPVSVRDVDVFCSSHHYELLESRQDNDVFIFRVRKP